MTTADDLVHDASAIAWWKLDLFARGATVPVRYEIQPQIEAMIAHDMLDARVHTFLEWNSASLLSRIAGNTPRVEMTRVHLSYHNMRVMRHHCGEA
jgi:hypothetical protein